MTGLNEELSIEAFKEIFLEMEWHNAQTVVVVYKGQLVI